MTFVFLIASFLLLVLSREALSQSLGRLTGPKAFAKVYFLIFLPGVAIHELSHFLMASLLLVPTGEIDLFPDEKRMASIEVAKTDPIRQSLIGLAPLILGTVALIAIFRLADPQNLFFLYLIFAISNTMFTSPSDRRTWLGLAAWLAIILIALYLFGVLDRLTPLVIDPVKQMMNQISRAYGLTFIVNLGFIFPLWLMNQIHRRFNI